VPPIPNDTKQTPVTLMIGSSTRDVINIPVTERLKVIQHDTETEILWKKLRYSEFQLSLPFTPRGARKRDDVSLPRPLGVKGRDG